MPKTQQKQTHVVVGDGLTAVAFVESCPLSAGDELIVLGKNASQLGRGAAYATAPTGAAWRYSYLLNSPADDIDPAFARWLSDNWNVVEEKMRGHKPDWLGAARRLVNAGDIFGLNAPREFFGDFIVEVAQKTLAKLRENGVAVRLIDGCVVSIEDASDHLLVKTNDGQRIAASSVDVAPGGPSNMRIDGDDGAFSAATLFGQEERIAEHIKAGAEIFCIGGNAAMLDALRLCQSLIPDGNIRFVACAPDGEVPEPLIPRTPRRLTKPTLTKGHATADSFLDELEKAIASAKTNGDEMREIRAGFRAHFLEHGLSEYLSDPAEARRVPGALRFWLRGGTRDTILDFHKLMKAGNTRMRKGLVRAVASQDNHANVVIEDADGNTASHKTGFVINCAGAGANSRYDPLTENMLERGWIAKCPISKGIVVDNRCMTGLPGVRYLSPATTVIGQETMAMPLYDALLLRTFAKRAYA